MCFSYSVNLKADRLQSRLDLPEVVLPQSGYFFSGFSYPLLPVIVANGNLHMTTMHWGLIPGWVKDEKQALEMRKLTLNARGETMHTKPMFRHAFQRHRCLVPAAGFYEWRDFNKKKYPYYVFPANDDCFLFAGIFDVWTNRESGEEISSYSIITCEANALMSVIHNSKLRMPLILEDSDIQTWLHGTPDECLKLVKPYPDEHMMAHTLSPIASQARADRNTPEVQEKYVYPELEQNLLF
ncbi:MAG: SOS response-associated peptidase [Bacteroidetes bacterium]|nr:SOS response-associated peptidase [Bacteroidota bacterium]